MFAERFADEGFASFLFDYRGFGDSEGQPRRLVSPRRHVHDLGQALEHVRNLRDIDPERVILWGTSLGGGHAITVAAMHPPISGVIAHVPHVDALASLARLGDPRHALRLIGAGLRDAARMATFREPYYVANVGRPGELAIMNTEDAWEGFLALIPQGTSFDNRCAARVALTFPFYRPIRKARAIRVPTLIVAATQDSLIPIERVRETAARIPDCQLVELDCPHFAPYTGTWFERSIRAQLDFLTRLFYADAP
jgi:pimeloyl-ACP methyl ester carboxylesterase